MSDYTLFFLQPDFRAVADAARQVYAPDSVEVEGSDEAWSRIVITPGAKSSVKLTPLQGERPGDKFSHIILGSYNFAKQLPGDKRRREQLMRDISLTEFLVGVHAIGHDPAEFVQRVVSSTKAYYFDGTSFYDAGGEVLSRK